jgi:hypothetical protein
MLKKTIIGIVAFVLVFGLGMFVGTKLKSKSAAPSGQENSFQAGYAAARERLKEQGMGVLSDNVEIKSVFGTVQKISGNSMTVKTISAVDLLANSDLDTRTVQIDNNTKFYQLVQKDVAQFQKEMEEFQKKTQEQKNSKDASVQPPATPMPYDKKEITLADIKEGQSVTAIANEDIKNKKEFTATEISIQFVPSVQGSSAQSSGAANSVKNTATSSNN